MEHFIDALKKYADFSGRATRKQYWMFVLFYIIFYLILGTIDAALQTFLLSPVFSLALFIPSISVAARRLHDTGRTGWWQLIYLIPLIGLIVMIVFLVQDSHGDNEYGPNQKQN
ncbi:Integral membrane protein [hydrothermal vent metagenome]|uniref:Integral membrane protein n=1 Tax=hydrothermal vent metagenome TaxID=652676 RepID=A0A3B0YSA1_9ZZZZ